jgi:hypothetical protein
MTADARRWPPSVAIGCLGVLLMAVTSLWFISSVGAATAQSPSTNVAVSTPTLSAQVPPRLNPGDAPSASGADLPDVDGAVFTALSRGVVRAVITAARGDSAKLAWWLLLPGIALGAVVVIGPRRPRPGQGLQRHAERAPPARS